MRDDCILEVPIRGQNTLQLTIPGNALAVRDGLSTMMQSTLFLALPKDGRDTAQIVMAEVLNNIVEHAYACTSGEIDLKITAGPAGLNCEFVDSGAPMPDRRLPAGVLKPTEPDGDLPEGGFGWFLIRSLSQDLHYCRRGDRNHLSFRLNSEQSKQTD